MIKTVNNYSKSNIFKTQTPQTTRSILAFGKNKTDTFVKTSKKRSRPISFLKDKEFRKTLAKAINADPRTIENVIGANELKWLLANKFEPNNFLPGKDNKNIKNGNFQVNLHNHTICSDGSFTPEEILNEMNSYSQKVQQPIFFSVTDHNKIDANRDIIKLISEKPKKYQNVYFIPGVEILSHYTLELNKKFVWFETLVYGLNPFNKATKDFINIKGDKTPDGRRSFPLKIIGDFFDDNVLMSVAHPQRVHYENIAKNDFFKAFKANGGKALETYYTYSETANESWAGDFPKLPSDKIAINQIENLTDKFGFLRTGGRDCHGKSIFYRA